MKKILITGATSGIMKELIKRIKDDYLIYATTHTVKELKNIKKIYINDNNIECFKLDITNNKDLEKIKELEIDVFLSNAAINNSGSIINMDIDKVIDNYNVNVFSNIKLIQIVLKNMIKKDSGKIIIISSISSLMPISFTGSYSSTKASLNNIAICLNKELKYITSNVKVTLILPGMYNTGFNKLMFDNKYNIDFDNLFKEELEMIKLKENLILKLIEKNNLNSIIKQIEKAIKYDNKFIYKAPLNQYIISKIYYFFKI